MLAAYYAEAVVAQCRADRRLVWIAALPLLSAYGQREHSNLFVCSCTGAKLHFLDAL